VRHGIGQLSPLYTCGIVPTAIGTEKGLALRVVAGDFFGAGKECEVVAALAVFRLVVNYAVFDFHLPDAEVPLEVCGIILRVPQAELDDGKNGEFRGLRAMVRHAQLPDFQIFVERHKVARARFNTAVFRGDRRVAHAVAAGIFLQFILRGLPRGGPEFAGAVIAKINVASANIVRSVVVAVTRDAPQPRVPVKRIAAGSIGDDAEIGLAAQVVDPRQWRLRLCDHVFAPLIVEITVFHEGGSRGGTLRTGMFV